MPTIIKGIRKESWHINAMSLRYKLLSFVRFLPNDCWQWRGKPSAKGYGVFWNGMRNVRAHRWSYEHFVECLPDGLVVDHLCRNRLCVNPDHLEPVTQKTNVLRGECPAAKQARQTHCIHGHVLSGVNLYIKPNGSRQCVPCRRLTDKRR